LLHHQNIAKCKQCFTVCCNCIIPWRKVFEYFLFGTFITNTDIFRPFAKCCLFFFHVSTLQKSGWGLRRALMEDMGNGSGIEKRSVIEVRKNIMHNLAEKNTFTRIVCSCFPRGDLKQVKVVVVGMPGSGAKSLASRWTTDTMEQPSNPGSVMFRHVQRSRNFGFGVWGSKSLTSQGRPKYLRDQTFLRFSIFIVSFSWSQRNLHSKQVGNLLSDLLRRCNCKFWHWDLRAVYGMSTLGSNQHIRFDVEFSVKHEIVIPTDSHAKTLRCFYFVLSTRHISATDVLAFVVDGSEQFDEAAQMH